MKKIVDYIRQHKLLYRLLKPLVDFLWRIYVFMNPFWCRVRRFRLNRVHPFIRNMTGRKQTQDLKKLYNKYKGRRIFVIASGPSLRDEDILQLKDEITIGVNGTIALYNKVGWKPTYFCTSDPVVYQKYKEEIIAANLKEALFDIDLKKYESELNFKPYYYDGYMKGTLLPHSDKRLKKNMQFNIDVYKKGVYKGGRSITTYAVQLAAYMGAKEIFLYGQDCDYSGAKQHFDDSEKDCKKIPAKAGFIDAIFIFYEKAKTYCESRGIKIYNATRGGKLEIFERVDFDEVLKNK